MLYIFLAPIAVSRKIKFFRFSINRGGVFFFLRRFFSLWSAFMCFCLLVYVWFYGMFLHGFFDRIMIKGGIKMWLYLDYFCNGEFRERYGHYNKEKFMWTVKIKYMNAVKYSAKFCLEHEIGEYRPDWFVVRIGQGVKWRYCADISEGKPKFYWEVDIDGKGYRKREKG